MILRRRFVAWLNSIPPHANWVADRPAELPTHPSYPGSSADPRSGFKPGAGLRLLCLVVLFSLLLPRFLPRFFTASKVLVAAFLAAALPLFVVLELLSGAALKSATALAGPAG